MTILEAMRDPQLMPRIVTRRALSSSRGMDERAHARYKTSVEQAVVLMERWPSKV